MKNSLSSVKTQKAKRFARVSRQRGVSLLELLIGITIGLLVTVAAVGSLVFTRVAATTVSDAVRLQQDAAVAMRMIGRQLKQVGAFPLDNAAAGGVGRVQFFTNYSGIANQGWSIQGTNGARDSFTTAFSVSNDAGALATDCFGQQTPAPQTAVTSTFQVTADSVFRCRGTIGDFQPVLNNVENLQIWYAVPVGANKRYFRADQISNNTGITPNWTEVQGVQVCLQLVGTTTGNPTAADPNVLDCNGNVMVSDGRVRRAFRQVFNLRNLGA